MAEDKLSDYERVRLENIQRNQAFLASLGLEDVQVSKGPRTGAVADPEKLKLKEARQRKRLMERKEEHPTRSSKRIRVALEKKEDEEDEEEQEEEEEEEEENQEFSYDDMPLEADGLDDDEFLLFVELRKWRLAKARAADIETYKVFPNRVLCEAIRRRRNTPEWAREADRSQLVDCWGIAKGKMESGVAVELALEMERPEAEALLARSRSRSLPQAGGGSGEETAGTADA